jgi:hypothetical protein
MVRKLIQGQKGALGGTGSRHEDNRGERERKQSHGRKLASRSAVDVPTL